VPINLICAHAGGTVMRIPPRIAADLAWQRQPASVTQSDSPSGVRATLSPNRTWLALTSNLPRAVMRAFDSRCTKRRSAFSKHRPLDARKDSIGGRATGKAPQPAGVPAFARSSRFGAGGVRPGWPRTRAERSPLGQGPGASTSGRTRRGRPSWHRPARRPWSPRLRSGRDPRWG
jgi:hypothetical protein